MNHFAHEGAKHPSFQRVNGGLERNAENNEEEVGHTQVEDKQIGGIVSDLSTSEQHGEHQAVADGAKQKDEGEDH